jgi:hypothetical protein
MHEKLKDALVLLAEVAGLLVVFIVFLLFLNFFNILSLSTIYPNQLGFLPHLSQSTNTNSTTNSTTQTQPQGAVPNNQSPVLANFAKLQNQASDNQMQKYQAYATRFSKPTVQTNPNDYISDAVFSGYDSKTIQVVTKEGVLNLSFDANTLFQKYAARQTNADGLISPTAYVSVQDFSKNVVFGSTVQIWYSKPNLKATQVNYAEAIKPIL